MNKPNNWLSQCASDTSIPTYTSQRGEDRILQKLFATIGTQNKWCVEFGATDGKAKSNTWYWINKQGWSSVQIEAARDAHLGLRDKQRWSFDALQERYGTNERVICVNRWVETSGSNSLDAIFAQTPLPRDFDLISIDVDGPDYDIWQSLQDYQPRVVVIEHNKTIPLEISFHSDRGSSLQALVDLGRTKGYELVSANDLNAVFVDRAEFKKLDITDNSPAELWQDHEKFRMSVTDEGGQIIFQGPSKLRWVRGLDGTLAGQLRKGKFIQISKDQQTIPGLSQDSRKKHLTGVVRGWYHSLTKPS